MSTRTGAEEFGKYKLDATSHDGRTHQLVCRSLSGAGSWQIWKRARSLGQGGFGHVWQESWEDEHGDRHFRAVKVCSHQKMQSARTDYKRELSALAAFSNSEVPKILNLLQSKK